jgi:ribosomal protein L40E
MKGPLHVIRRRAKRPANEADGPQAASEAPTTSQPVAAVGSAEPPPAAEAPNDAPSAPAAEAAEAPTEQPTGEIPAGQENAPKRPSFRERGRVRRRLRYLRRVRELGFRDLGGLIFDQHRFSRVNEELVAGKLHALAAVDAELRALERALDDRRPITELREPGISVCPRCGALHGSDARFCPSCGIPFSGPRAMAEIGESVSMSVGEIGAVRPATAPAPQPTQAFSPAEQQPPPARRLFMTGEPPAEGARVVAGGEPARPAEVAGETPGTAESEGPGAGAEVTPPPAGEPPGAAAAPPTDVVPPADAQPSANGDTGDPLAPRAGERSEP